jgi:hypothetical protein
MWIKVSEPYTTKRNTIYFQITNESWLLSQAGKALKNAEVFHSIVACLLVIFAICIGFNAFILLYKFKHKNFIWKDPFLFESVFCSWIWTRDFMALSGILCVRLLFRKVYLTELFYHLTYVNSKNFYFIYLFIFILGSFQSIGSMNSKYFYFIFLFFYFRSFWFMDSMNSKNFYFIYSFFILDHFDLSIGWTVSIFILFIYFFLS